MHPLDGRALVLWLPVVVDASRSSSLFSRQQWDDPSDNIPTTPEKCIDASFSTPGWGIVDPAIITVNGSSGGSTGDIRFLTVNPASGVVANCTAQNIELIDPPDVWHNCSIPDLYFNFNLETMDMRLKGSWSCEGSEYVRALPGGPNPQ